MIAPTLSLTSIFTCLRIRQTFVPRLAFRLGIIAYAVAVKLFYAHSTHSLTSQAHQLLVQQPTTPDGTRMVRPATASGCQYTSPETETSTILLSPSPLHRSVLFPYPVTDRPPNIYFPGRTSRWINPRITVSAVPHPTGTQDSGLCPIGNSHLCPPTSLLQFQKHTALML